LLAGTKIPDDEGPSVQAFFRDEPVSSANLRRATLAQVPTAGGGGRILEAFGAQLRDHVDLDTLIAEVLAVVEETMQPTQASLWLRP
jgi:hypothetical protein